LSHSPIEQEITAFLIDRQARGLSPSTIEYYREKLATFRAYCIAQGVSSLYAVTARLMRSFLLALFETHNPGGVHGHYRAVRAFLNWWEMEVEPAGWANPMRKVRAPKVRQEPLPPVVLEDLRAMLRTCERKTFAGDRDRALLMLDTGVRRAEMCALNIEDLNLVTGTILIRRGKGGGSRTTFVGAKTRRALVAYLRHRPGVENREPLWVTVRGTRLSYAGLGEIVRRRAKRAGVRVPSLHAFRRAFALSCLRNGMDIFALQRLL
ncbi:unnamed protein product, partial [marine sediment metagenome]